MVAKTVETDRHKFTYKAMNVVLCDDFGNVISDTIGHSIIVTDVDHYMIHIGASWVHSDRVSVTNGANKDILIKNGTTGEIHIKDFVYTSALANGYLTLYKNPTISANGTQKTLINKHLGKQSLTPYSAIYQDPTITDVGTFLETYSVIGSKQDGGTVPGGGDEWVIPASTNMLLRFTNNGPGTDTVTFAIKLLDIATP
jgi:hypothetical protein